MEIKWFELAGRTGYLLAAGMLIPTYRLGDKDIVLVDSGTLPEPGLPSFFMERGLRVSAVVQTHLHYDHIANNCLLEEAFGTKIYASEAEIRGSLSPENRAAVPGFVRMERSPKTAPSFDFPIIPIPDGSTALELDGTVFAIENLCGHSSGHIGIGTPDNVLCLGDAILSPSLVRYAKFPFFQYPDLSVSTMKSLLPAKYEYYAMAHQEVIEARDLPGLIYNNIALQDRLDRDILELINEPAERDELIRSVAYSLDIHVRSVLKRTNLYFAVLLHIDSMVRKGLLVRISENGCAFYGRGPKASSRIRAVS